MLLAIDELKPIKPTREEQVILANWGVLHSHLVQQEAANGLKPSYILKLLRCEVATKKRLVLATRLLGVYHRLAREENERRLAVMLGAK